jgi:hypothetical protein
MGADCFSPAVITPDTLWVACVSSPLDLDGSDRLQLAALEPTGTMQVRQLQVSPSPFYGAPAWSPDGRYLAITLGDVGSGCLVAVLASPPPHMAFTQVLTLTSAAFSDQDACWFQTLAWSADGQQLWAMGSSTRLAEVYIAAVPLALLLGAAARAAPGQVVTYDVPSDQVQTFPAYNSNLEPLVQLLSPQDKALYYTAWVPTGEAPLAQEQLRRVDLRTGQVQTLFTLPDQYLIRALTWLPDGRLLLATGDSRYPHCVDCNGYHAISDVYAYSPEVLS